MNSMRWYSMMHCGLRCDRLLRKNGWNGWFIWGMTGVSGKNMCRAEKFSDETGI